MIRGLYVGDVVVCLQDMLHVYAIYISVVFLARLKL
jgi:hypothetical protein